MLGFFWITLLYSKQAVTYSLCRVKAYQQLNIAEKGAGVCQEETDLASRYSWPRGKQSGAGGGAPLLCICSRDVAGTVGRGPGAISPQRSNVNTR